MQEHDAFGREIGEDPLASLRDATRDGPVDRPPTKPPTPPPPRPVPAPAPGPAPEPEPLPAPERTTSFVRPPARRTPRRRSLAGLMVTLSLAGVGVAVAVGALTDAGDDLQGRIDSLVPPAVAPAEPAEAEAEAEAVRAPTGLQRASLIRRRNLERALATLRRAELGRIAILRVAPDRVDAVLVGRGGRRRSAQVTFDGELRRFGGGARGLRPTIGYGRIDAAAPERLVRAAARRARRASTRSIDYVLLTAGSPAEWGVWGAYFKSGTIVKGDAGGRLVRVL